MKQQICGIHLSMSLADKSYCFNRLKKKPKNKKQNLGERKEVMQQFCLFVKGLPLPC